MQSKLRPYFLLLSLVGAIGLTFAVFLPFLKPLVLAAVFAVVLQGLYNRTVRLLGGWPSVAALLTVFVGVLLILLPLSFFGVLVGNEAAGLYTSIEQGGGRSVISDMLVQADATFSPAVPGLHGLIGEFSASLDTYARNVLQWIAGHAGDIFSGVSQFLLSFFIFFIALYYLLRDGKKVRQMLIELSPLSNKEDEGVLDRLELSVNSTIKGSLSIALIQGVLTTVGFAVFGVPNAILWGAVAALAALIPGIGTALVLTPGVIYLFFIGSVPAAVGLLIWGVIAVGLIDNLLGPKIVGKKMRIHPLLVLLSILGGIMYFGPTGIFLGPLSISLLFALLSIYTDVSRSAEGA